jgi:hypothetical protein
MIRRGNGHDRGRRVVRADGRDGDRATRAEGIHHLGRQGPDHSARLDQLGKQVPTQTEAADEPVVPRAAVEAQQPSGRGVGSFGDLPSGEPVGEKVGHEQHGVGRIERAVAPVDGELEQGAERQVLQAIQPIELILRHHIVHGGNPGGRASVAVVVRLAEHPIVPHQRVVDRPGVDTDARESRLVSDGGRESVRGVAIEVEDVPVQSVDRANGVIGEAGDRPDRQLVGPDLPEHDPSTRRAQVDRGDGLSHPAPLPQPL